MHVSMQADVLEIAGDSSWGRLSVSYGGAFSPLYLLRTW